MNKNIIKENIDYMDLGDVIIEIMQKGIDNYPDEPISALNTMDYPDIDRVVNDPTIMNDMFEYLKEPIKAILKGIADTKYIERKKANGD